jgi:nitric oxide dioxygenase
VQLTGFTDLALRIVMRLAVLGDGSATTAMLAEQLRVKQSHAAKVVTALHKLGVVEARRGRSGGLRLAEGAQTMSIGSLVRQLEGPGEVVDCEGSNPCPLRGGCRLRAALAHAREAFFAALDPLTVADVTAGPTRTLLLELAPPRGAEPRAAPPRKLLLDPWKPLTAYEGADRLAVPRLDRGRPSHLPVVGAAIGDITPVFYRRLFAAHPELQRDLLHRGNQAQGDQQRALAASIAAYATLLVAEDGPEPRETLARIAHRHASLGVVEEHYPIVHEHLFAALVEVLGAAVTPEVAAAWDEVYWHMARDLIELEKGLYAAARTTPGDVFRTLVVSRRTLASPDTVSLEMVDPIGSPLPDARPSQDVSVAVLLPDGAHQIRQDSLTGAHAAGAWAISVKAVAARRTEEGVVAPAGEVSSLLHHLVETGSQRQVSVLHADRSPARHAHRAQLDSLVKACPLPRCCAGRRTSAPAWRRSRCASGCSTSPTWTCRRGPTTTCDARCRSWRSSRSRCSPGASGRTASTTRSSDPTKSSPRPDRGDPCRSGRRPP